MKLFQCQNCGQPLYFENTVCESCGLALGYLAARETITLLKNDGAIAPLDPGRFRTVAVIGSDAWVAHSTLIPELRTQRTLFQF